MKRELIGSFGPVSTFLEKREDGTEHFVLVSGAGHTLCEVTLLDAAEARKFVDIMLDKRRNPYPGFSFPNRPTQLRDLLSQIRTWAFEQTAKAGVAGLAAQAQRMRDTLTPRELEVLDMKFGLSPEEDARADEQTDAWLERMKRAGPVAAAAAAAALEMKRREAEEAAGEHDRDRYYIIDSRSCVGNCALWWKPDGKGYTCNLDDAGLYTLEEAESNRLSDVPVPWELARGLVVPHVRWEHLNQAGVDISGAKTGKRERMTR